MNFGVGLCGSALFRGYIKEENFKFSIKLKVIGLHKIRGCGNYIIVSAAME